MLVCAYCICLKKSYIITTHLYYYSLLIHLLTQTLAPPHPLSLCLTYSLRLRQPPLNTVLPPL